MKKVIAILAWLTDQGMLLGLILCFLVGVYGLYDSYMICARTDDPGLLYYKPGYEDGKKPDREIQGRMAAWLTIEDAGIDYPVMQGKDNTEYLTKDPYGEYSLAGSIFLDARNAPDLTDAYSMIYGHHMEGGLMFGSLDRYLDKKWFFSHQDGTLSVGGKAYPLKIFAVVEADAAAEEIFSPTELDPGITFRYVQENALYYDASLEPRLDEGDHLLGLSTCKYPDTTERTVIFGRYTL